MVPVPGAAPGASDGGEEIRDETWKWNGSSIAGHFLRYLVWCEGIKKDKRALMKARGSRRGPPFIPHDQPPFIIPIPDTLSPFLSNSDNNPSREENTETDSKTRPEEN